MYLCGILVPQKDYKDVVEIGMRIKTSPPQSYFSHDGTEPP